MAKLQDTKLRGRIQLCFYTAAMNNLKRGIREAIPLSKAPERRGEYIYININIYMNKFNSGGEKICLLEIAKSCPKKN